MKFKLVSIVCTAIILAGVQMTALSQCKEFKWPEDKAKAEEAVAVWGDALKQGNFRSATSHWQWMANAAPQWNTKLYIDGAEIYDKLAEKETDAAKKKVLVDSLLLIYDLRLKNCGDEVNVMNRKAYASYKYNFKSKEALPGLLQMYDKVFESSGANVTDGNLVAYMTVVKNYQTLYKSTPDKALTDEQIINRYEKIEEAADLKIKKSQEQQKQADVDKIKGYKDAVTGLLVQIVKVDCDFVKKNLAPKFKANPNDLAVTKQIFTFMLQGKCTDDPLFLEAMESIDRNNPEKDFGLKKTIASRYLAAGETEKAEAKFKEALELAPTPKDKSELTVYQGMMESKKGNYSGARETFRQAASLDPSNKEPWEKIGDLYYNSADNCAKKISLAEDRLVYLAAYEMYQKAGNAQLMQRAKAQFPSKEEIFLLNWQAGTTQKVGCWIGETVTIKTRD